MTESADFHNDDYKHYGDCDTHMDRAKWLISAEEWDGDWELNLIDFVEKGGLRFLYEDAWRYQDLASS